MLDTRFRSYGRLLLSDHGGTALCNIGYGYKKAIDTYQHFGLVPAYVQRLPTVYHPTLIY